MAVSIARTPRGVRVPALKRTDHRAARAAFEAAYERWLPRVYRFAAARLPSEAEAELVTRRVLERAFGSALFQGVTEPAPGLLALVKAELARHDGESLT